MSSAAAPVVPPRPNRNGQEHLQPEMPKVPPRPIKRTVSPNPDRYAPSPFSGGIPAKKDRSHSRGESIDRSGSNGLPAVVGEEGMEYAALEEQLSSRPPSTSPTQTRTIGDDLKIHAPTAGLPAQSAKQRIMLVTRTDSDKAASYGIGRPSTEVPSPSTRSLKKKASTTSQLSHSELDDEERGIPEIGVHVPLLAHAGDVQAPSPSHGSDASKLNHKRMNSRGLPPGSYGLHGHNVVPEDKLGKQYYEKRPELLRLERHSYQHDRATDFSMSHDDLNKMVRESELHSRGVDTSDDLGTPSEQAGWAAYTASASRPQSTKPLDGSLKHDAEPIVIDEPNQRRSVLFSDEATPAPPQDEPETHYRAPILAEDEVRKNAPRFDQVPAVELSRDRGGSDYEMEPPRSRPASRPTSRPASLYKIDSADMRSTPLEDVEEYEPLFPEDEEVDGKHSLTAAQIKEMKQRFPSRDIWEEPPNSVHYTAEVSTPDVEDEDQPKKFPPREQTETPAHAFARQQEELAEREGTHPDAFLWRTQKPSYASHYSHPNQNGQALWNQDPRKSQQASHSNSTQSRFPSRDVWEDTPDSLKLETTVSGPQMDQASPVDKKPEVPDRPQRQPSLNKDKPVIPERPKPKSAEETATKPVIPDRPKPQVPARPTKASTAAAPAAASGDGPAPKAKPAVPARPAGNKIAALQAGFMADLNKKLGLGPQAPKTDEEPEEEKAEVAPAAEKAPLSDSRRGRARGPQRRAPTAAAPPTAKAAVAETPKLSFSSTVTVWSLDPEIDDLVLDEAVEKEEAVVEAPAVETLHEQKKGLEEPSVEEEQKHATDIEEKAAKSAPEIETEAEARAEEARVTQEVVNAEEKLDQEEEERTAKKEEQGSLELKTETVATNTAGETLAEATVEKDKAASQGEPREADASVVRD